MKNIYPLTLIKSRYGGVYEGGKFCAFNADLTDIIDSTGSDLECSEFFTNVNFGKLKDDLGEIIVCGKGATPEEAINSLENKLKIKLL